MIEIDGDVHGDKFDQDEFRDKYLKSLGIKTLRISNDEILLYMDEVLTKIMTFL